MLWLSCYRSALCLSFPNPLLLACRAWWRREPLAPIRREALERLAPLVRSELWELQEQLELLELLELPAPARLEEPLPVPEPEWRPVKAWRAAPVGLRVTVYGS